MKRIVALLASAALLLAGCATTANKPGGDSCQLDPNPSGSGLVIQDALFLPVYLIYGFSCVGIRAMDRHGVFDAAPKGKLEDGIYTAADGTFSVAPPPGLGIHEEFYPQLDYVLFAPRLVKGPVYGINVNPDLEPIYGQLTLDEFAQVSLRDARFQSRLANGVPLQELRREEITLDGRPALAVTYSQTPRGADKPSAYYLLYFMKTRHRSAVLSVAWPKECPACATGPEADVRAMDPALHAFVDSFILVGTGGRD